MIMFDMSVESHKTLLLERELGLSLDVVRQKVKHSLQHNFKVIIKLLFVHNHKDIKCRLLKYKLMISMCKICSEFLRNCQTIL